MNNMLGEEEFLYRVLKCDSMFPLYGGHISGVKVGYRLEAQCRQEVFSGIL